MDIKVVPVDPANAKPVPVDDFGFGNKFANYMFTQHYTAGEGWHDATIGPYEPLGRLPPH